MNKTYLSICTDVHGLLSTTSTIDGSTLPYGFSRYVSFLNQLNPTDEVVRIDNGDSLQGSPLMTYAHRTALRPSPMSQAMNLIKLDYVNVGNHDFNYGEQALMNYLNELNAVCLTSNVLYKGKPLGSSQIHRTQSGHRLGLIGVVTDYIPNWERPEHIQNFTFLNPLDVVAIEVQKYRAIVDFIIVFYHGGLERDPKTGEPTEVLTGENVGYALSQIPGIDAIISGHQHRSISTTINSALFMQCSLNLQESMWVEIDHTHHKLAGKLIDLSQFPVHQGFEAGLRPLQAATNRWLDTEIGSIEGQDCLIHDPFEARLHKHPMVSLINQIQLKVSGADLSATALFNQPIGLPRNIRMRDIVNNYVYPNTLVVKDIDGQTLRAYLEQNANYFELDNDDVIRVNPSFNEPKPQHFNYDMVDGIEYGFDIAKPVGQRLTHLFFNGKSIADDQRFTLVMNNYRASGGGNFHMIAACKTLKEFPLDMSDLMAEYVQTHSPIRIQHHENITITANL